MESRLKRLFLCIAAAFILTAATNYKSFLAQKLAFPTTTQVLNSTKDDFQGNY